MCEEGSDKKRSRVELFGGARDGLIVSIYDEVDRLRIPVRHGPFLVYIRKDENTFEFDCEEERFPTA